LVALATERALGFLSGAQTSHGGFISSGASGVESCVQVITALCELGISLEDERFVKNQNTVLNCLLSYYEKGKGFKHTLSDTEHNIMSTEQALYGIAAIIRREEGRNSLYNMSDAVDLTKGANLNSSVHPDVNIPQRVFPQKTFSDIKGHSGQQAVENLAARGIVNGKSEDIFDPDNTVTRAEFSTILVRALGLKENGNSVFSDVEKEAWYHNYVNTAYAYGIINGTSKTTFNPEGKITRQEAAVMVSGAATLCGMKVKNDMTFSRDVLCQFIDYVKAAQWAMPSLAFCYSEGILPDDDMNINPSREVTRAEICMMLNNMLLSADLL